MRWLSESRLPNQILDSYPLPATFRHVSDKEYTFNDGDWGGEVTAVSRYFEPGPTETDPRASVRDVLASSGVEIRDSAEDIRSGRIRTVYEGVNVIVYVDADPIEVRAFELV